MALSTTGAAVSRKFISAVATIGSVVVHHDKGTGKNSINVIPAVTWLYGISVLGCALTRDEPFSTCVRSIMTAVGG